MTLPEFVHAVSEKLPDFSKSDARRFFRAADSDGNGTLDYTEVHTMLHAMQSAVVRRQVCARV